MILEHCKDGYRSLKPLHSSVPKTSLYRCVEKLIKDGDLEKGEGGYKTTPPGLYKLEHKKPTIEWSELEKFHPVLGYIPTKVHRAIVELILAAIVARGDEIRKDHHPAFILFGATMKWKTWVAKFVCAVLGLDPVRTIILMTSESGRSILTRKGYGGETVSQREVLTAPFVCFDEYHDAEISAKRLCNIYIQGEKQVSYENNILTIEPVPLLTLNPRGGEGLMEKIGFKEPQIRRSVVCNLDAMEIPSEVKTKGEEILEKVRKHEPLKLPQHKNQCFKYRDDVYALLEKCLGQDIPPLVDVEMLLLLCSGMTAFLPEKRAVAQALYDYMTIVETLGWVQKGWQETLLNFIADLSMDGNNLKQPAIGAAPSALPSLRNSVKQMLEVHGDSIDYDSKVGKLKDKLEEISVSVEDAEVFIDVHQKLKKLGFGPDEASAIAKEVGNSGVQGASSAIRNFGSLEKAVSSLRSGKDGLEKQIKSAEESLSNLLAEIQKLGSTPETVEKLLGLYSVLRKHGIGLPRLEVFIQTHSELEKLGFDIGTAKLIAGEFNKNKDLGLSGGVQRMVRYVTSAGGLEQAVAEKESELKKKSAELKGIEKQVGISNATLADVSNKISALREQKSGLEGQVSNLRGEVKRKREEREETLRNLSAALNTKADAEEIKNAIARLEEEKGKIEGEIKGGQEKLEGISKKHDEFKDEIELVGGWRSFIFSKEIPSYESFWDDLSVLLEIRRGEKQHLAVYKEQIADRVRKRLVELYAERISSDVVPKWMHESEIRTQKEVAEARMAMLDYELSVARKEIEKLRQR